MTGTWVTEFWLDKNLDQSEFETAFAERFPGGKAQKIEECIDAKPGYSLYHLSISNDHKQELFPFLDEYAESHCATNERRSSTTYPFSESSFPKDKSYPADSVQCDGCGGLGCVICNNRGWLTPKNNPHGRRCANEECNKPLSPNCFQVYCSNDCAISDAQPI